MVALRKNHPSPLALDPQLTKLKPDADSASKFFNWNIIAKEIKKFGIEIAQP
jgi:hypothetical protein